MPDHGNGNSEGYRRDLRDHFHLPLYGGGRLGAGATAAALAWAGVLEEPPSVAACETRKRRRTAQARELGVEEMVCDAHAATAGTAIDVKRRSERMENEDSLKIERLEDDGLQDVSGGAGDYVSHYQCPKTGKQLSSYDPYFARDCTMCQYWKQVIPGIRAECRY